MKNITNMGPLRTCMLFLVVCVQLQVVLGKPLFFDMICDLICDDDDDTSTTTSNSNEDDYDIFGLCTCGTRRPPGSRRRGNFPNNINMRLPPSANGMNFSMSNNNGQWSFDFGQNGPPNGLATIIGPTTLTPINTGGVTTATVTTAASTTAKK